MLYLMQRQRFDLCKILYINHVNRQNNAIDIKKNRKMDAKPYDFYILSANDDLMIVLAYNKSIGYRITFHNFYSEDIE